MGQLGKRALKCLERRLATVEIEILRKEKPVISKVPFFSLLNQVPVPSTAAIWVMLGYLSIGTVMFAEWEVIVVILVVMMVVCLNFNCIVRL